MLEALTMPVILLALANGIRQWRVDRPVVRGRLFRWAVGDEATIDCGISRRSGHASASSAAISSVESDDADRGQILTLK